MERTIFEINEKINSGKANILTGSEAKSLIKEKGTKYFLDNVDVVTFAAFELNTNALLYLSFGQADPMIYFSEVEINNIQAYPCGPTDVALSVVAFSQDNIEYGGAHVIEDLVLGKDAYIKAFGHNYNVFLNKEFETKFNLKEVNQAKLFLNQAINQNSIVATNSSEKDIDSPMGTLIGKIENSTFNSSSYLNPLVNDPFCKTIGLGSKIWVAGSEGIITGFGSNHNPKQKRNEKNIPVGPAATLSLSANLKEMNSKWIRGGYIKSFGPVLYIGIGIPIPILNAEIAENVAIDDDNIQTTIVDFSIPRRVKPTFGQCSYSELRSSTVVINKKPTLTSTMSSMAYAMDICNALKNSILDKRFFLSQTSGAINMNLDFNVLNQRL